MSNKVPLIPVPENVKREGTLIKSMEAYKELYKKTAADPTSFWRSEAENLSWFHEYDQVLSGSFQEGNVRWFSGGKLNVCFNCVDRHVNSGHGDQVAFIHEADEPGNDTKITYNELLAKVCQLASALKALGIKKGDPVTIYLPMIPEIAYVMLACARIGAPHSVVFAGFSADALKERIIDVNSRFIITTDIGMRGGKVVPMKSTVDTSIEHIANEGPQIVEKVFVISHGGNKLENLSRHEVDLRHEAARHRPYCPAAVMDSEDALFYLYTSGSTGKPKGLLHTTAGYLVHTMTTFRYAFDYQPGEVFGCVADAGWATGHSYSIYGPLANRATTLLFESTPLYPNPSRYWNLVETHRVTHFYTAPTAIRALMRHGTKPLENYDLSSLRVLATAGEPINPEAWKWYSKNVGKDKCPILDTYWQTETGGILITPFPAATPLKPGSATLPFFGIVPVRQPDGVLTIKHPWPGMARTVYGDHERYMNTYFRPYPGYYFTGDGCEVDEDGYFWITGRVDDVMNVSGHRIGSAEVESALVEFDAVAEAAAIGFPHDVKGEAIAVYVILKHEYDDLLENHSNNEDAEKMRNSLRQQVRKLIGPFASPDLILLTKGLPKTRSGKIMRRLLRKIAQGEQAKNLGDVSTLEDSSVVNELIEIVRVVKK
eukprot:augustus_masked-scaffold_60-processed-gene-0.75-mRNA-1 protein AED:0.03 eAED:0.03 QI:0/-1/0/1/-1/1/1/0/656